MKARHPRSGSWQGWVVLKVHEEKCSASLPASNSFLATSGHSLAGRCITLTCAFIFIGLYLSAGRSSWVQIFLLHSNSHVELQSDDLSWLDYLQKLHFQIRLHLQVLEIRTSVSFYYYYWLHWVFVVACRLTLVVGSGSYSLVCLWWVGTHCGSFCRGAQALGHELSSCEGLLRHTGLVAPQHVESSWTRDWTRVPCIGRRTLYHWTTREIRDISIFEGKNSTHKDY